MSDFIFNQEQYLKRIDYKGKIFNDFESLKSLHKAQYKVIPFENFDICLRKSISLEPKDLIEKLVKNKRGGYCFELNGLLLLALKSFGFEARALLARVHITGEPTGKGHQITLVTIGKKQWLVDLGFGSNSPLIPIPLVYDHISSFENKAYRLIESDLYGYMLQSKLEGEWKNLYSFDLSQVFKGDIEYGNHYTSTSQNSFFTFSRVATLPIENGIVTIYNNNLKRIINGVEENEIIEEGQSYIKVLNDEFGIVLNAKYNDLKPLPQESS